MYGQFLTEPSLNDTIDLKLAPVTCLRREPLPKEVRNKADLFGILGGFFLSPIIVREGRALCGHNVQNG